MWMDLCSLITKAVAERAMLPSGKNLKKNTEKHNTKKSNLFHSMLLLLVFLSHLKYFQLNM